MIQSNLEVADQLDFIFSRADISYCLFNKANNEINCIHNQSNHLPSLIKQLRLSIENEQFDLICNGITLKHSSYEKILGVKTIDNKLCFDEHITKICKTENKK